MTPEGKVKADIKRWLHKRGWFFFLPVSNGMGRHGVHDFVCCEPVLITPDMVGQVIGAFRTIEAKALGRRGTVSEAQKDFAEEVRAAGGKTIVCDNVSQLDSEPWL